MFAQDFLHQMDHGHEVPLVVLDDERDLAGVAGADEVVVGRGDLAPWDVVAAVAAADAVLEGLELAVGQLVTEGPPRLVEQVSTGGEQVIQNERRSFFHLDDLSEGLLRAAVVAEVMAKSSSPFCMALSISLLKSKSRNSSVSGIE